ncbi:MAG: BON domain-containing protein [Bacteroidota bacterium]
MKHSKFKLAVLALSLAASMQFTSCSGGKSDADILDNFNKEVQKDNKMTGISATVTDGVLTLNGQCADEDCRKHAEDEAKEVKGVKSVVNNITLASATMPTAPEVSGDATLETGVRDATKDFPGVSASVVNGEITLTGEIQRDRLATLMQSLNGLNAKKINNNLTIK